jgi:hypothetical protein
VRFKELRKKLKTYEEYAEEHETALIEDQRKKKRKKKK